MHPCLWMYVVLCMCLAFCVGCIVCTFKMDGYMEDMDKEKEWSGEMVGICIVSLLPRVEYLALLLGPTPYPPNS